jgi:hypothetical protein
VTLTEQLREVTTGVGRIIKAKPWLLIPPVLILAWLSRNDPDTPWWLSIDHRNR